MKQYTTSDQTAKLIELGFEKPKAYMEDNVPFEIRLRPAYSIGELIEMLEDFASVVISYSYQKNGYYVRVIIPKRIGGGMYRISQTELVDALYYMLIDLLENDLIHLKSNEGAKDE